MTALPFNPMNGASPQPMMPVGQARPPMAPGMAMQAPQPPPPPEPDPRAWAKAWKRPEEWTDDYLLTKFTGWDKTDNAHWKDWKDEAKVNYDMVAGRQLPDDAKAANEEAGLVSITINKIDATVSAVSGSEMTNQQETKFYPRETSTRGPDGRLQDVAVNELLTGAADYVREESDQADEESEAFRDTLICGLGVTEGRMDYDVDPDGMAVVERCDPIEFRIQAGAQRPNAADATRITREKPFSKDDAKSRFGVEEGGKQPSWEKGAHDNNPGSAYKGNSGETTNADDVWICEYQWWELEKLHKVLNPITQQIEELTEAEFAQIIQLMPELEANSASLRVRRYYRAFRCGDQILEVTPLPDEEFTYKFITGKFDRNKKVWYGLVRAMVDPQRLLNKQISQTQRIVDTNAKGGLLAEVDAFEDPQEAEANWAASDTIVWTKAGKLQSGAVMPKPIAPTPAGIDKLLMIANEAIPSTSGVNAEMLGIVDRQQAGVVDVARKEAAYGVLQAFFRGLKRYRKQRGRHTLKLITRYMSDERLIRINGRNGSVQYLPLVRQPSTAKFDVIVDDAPAGPNQKEKVMSWLMMVGAPLLARMNLPPQILFKFMEFSPLPSSLVQEIQQEYQKIPPVTDPNQLKAQAETQIEQMRLQMEAQSRQQDSMLKMQEAQFNAQIAQREAMAQLQLEQSKNAAAIQLQERMAAMQAETDRRAAEQKIAIEAQKADILAELQRMKSESEMAIATMKAQMEAQLKRDQFEFEKGLMVEQQSFDQEMAKKEAAAGAASRGSGTDKVQFGGDPG